MTLLKIRIRHVFAAVIAACCGSLPAAVITVGTPAGPCTCDSVQCAFNLAASNGEASNEVRLMYYGGTNGFAFYDTQYTLNVGAGKEVIVTGGYGECASNTLTTTKTGIDGHNTYSSNKGSTLTINVGAGGTARLRLLDIGNGISLGSGGAVHFTGTGTLEITDSNFAGNQGHLGGAIGADGNGILNIASTTILNNAADYGGGIGSDASGSDAELNINDSVQVAGNVAYADGGGIWARGLPLTMAGAGSSIYLNHADSGHGGGVDVLSSSGSPGLAFIKSPGNAVHDNTAAYGGGISVRDGGASGDVTTSLSLRSIDIANPVRLAGNFASVQGGGVYAKAREDFSGYGSVQLDVGGFARIENNAAPSGAAFYLESDNSVFANGPIAPFLEMTSGAIVGNNSRNAANQKTNGAIVSGESPSDALFDRTEFSGNDGGLLVNSTTTNLKNALVVANTANGNLLQFVYSMIAGTTIANNQVTGAYVLVSNADLTLTGSIIDQPGKTTLQHSGALSVNSVLSSSESASLGGFPNAFSASPRFVDPAHADYHLQAASPAVDRALADPSEPKDFAGAPRDVRIPGKQNYVGPRDLGALERQALPPLVLNGSFDSDLRLWSPLDPSAAFWIADSSQADGTGAVHVVLPAPAGGRVNGLHQCVPLPGSGIYSLRGNGKSQFITLQDKDYVKLEWTLYDNSETCQGTPLASGGLFLPNSKAWSAVAAPTLITLPFDQWTEGSALDVALIALDGNVSGINDVDGYFDMIQLDYLPDGDRIFSGDFEVHP